CQRPDLVGLDWPPARPGWLSLRIGMSDQDPEAALVPSCVRTGPLLGARALGLEGPARGTREFLRRRANARQSPPRATGTAASTLITCLVQPVCCNRHRSTRRSPKAGVRRSDCNDYHEERFFDGDTPRLDF